MHSVSDRLYSARLGTDVPAILHAFKANFFSGFVSSCQRRLQGRAPSGHSENPATVGNDGVALPVRE